MHDERHHAACYFVVDRFHEADIIADVADVDEPMTTDSTDAMADCCRSGRHHRIARSLILALFVLLSLAKLLDGNGRK
jgi:hypothetical protein